jgi:hypothetical protein
MAQIVKNSGLYEVGSGQKLNLLKTSIFFSQNTSQTRREEILRLSGLTKAHRFDTYLGLPALVWKSKAQAFSNIKEKVGKKLTNWKVKFLSQARKEVLLKPVVQAMPTYSMSVFMLPVTLYKDLNTTMQQFWWSHMANSSRIHWMSWERMGRSKNRGGLGFQDLSCFNRALLAKRGWRLIQNPSSLVGRIFQAKYFPKSTFLEASLGNHLSFAWRSIFSARGLLQQGLLWRVGKGASINVWGDRWIPTPTSYTVQSQRTLLPRFS